MRIVIAQTNLQNIDTMLKCWQQGEQWGIVNETEKELWKENAKGIRTSATDQMLVQLYNDSTGIVYILACLRDWRGNFTISEVVSNPQLAMEKDSASPTGKVFMTWVSRQSPFDDKQGLGCLFSWASGKSKGPIKLTANTMGLIKLYGNYGFEIEAPAKPGVNAYLSSPSPEKKYSRIDQNMKLSESQRQKLQQTYLVDRDWIFEG